ncbi:hypothetical protein RCL1_001856 [Eukaryota sp. TZLM3-RCL]
MQQILIRSREGCGLLTWNGTELSSQTSFATVPDASDCCWSSDGSTMFVSAKSTLHVYSGTNLSLSATIQLVGLTTFFPSPSGAYVAVLCRPAEQKSDSYYNNLRIYRVSDQKLLYSDRVSSYTIEQWPLISFSFDERFAIRVASEGVIFLALSSSIEQSHVIYTYRQSNVFSASISPSLGSYHLVLFVKEHQQANHVIINLTIPSHLALSGIGPTVLQRYVVGAANSVSISWGQSNPSSLTNSMFYAVVKMNFDIDRANSSYHGTSKAVFVPFKRGLEAKRLALPNGPVQAVEISKNSGDFIVLAGFNPCFGYIFDSNGNLKPSSLPQRNQAEVQYSHGGRLVAVAGFGNLRSGFAIYQSENDCFKLRVDCSEVENVTTWSWLNDGSGLVIGTTSPRLRVNNMIGILLNNGVVAQTRDFDVLYSILPRPPRGDTSRIVDKIIPLTKTVAKPVEETSSAYIPPHLRNKVIERKTTSLSELSGEIASVTIQPPRSSYLPPGLPLEHLSQHKPAKKKNSGGGTKKQAPAFVIEFE